MSDLFESAPRVAQGRVIAQARDRTYYLVPKGERFAVNWTEPHRDGVVGGYYPDEEHAIAAIEAIEVAKAMH